MSSNTIFEDVTLLLSPFSFANHGSSVDLHPFVGETTPQAIVVVGNPTEPNEPKKKKPMKVKWEIN
jgi:hypothetical protein